jgi:hypothetical protein
VAESQRPRFRWRDLPRALDTDSRMRAQPDVPGIWIPWRLWWERLRSWFVAALVVVVLVESVLLLLYKETTSNTHSTRSHGVATTATSPAYVWKTLYTFSGKTNANGDNFTLPSNADANLFKLDWGCTPQSGVGGSFALAVVLRSQYGAPLAVPVQAQCRAGATGGSTYVHNLGWLSGGTQLYLDVSAQGSWWVDIQVQVKQT